MSTRNTIQKQVILNAVRELKNHPTSEDVYNYIKPNFPSISLGTVYRNLNLLSESRDIVKISLLKDAVRFDDEVQNHYHFQCKSCGRLLDIFTNYQTSIDEVIAKESGLKIEKHDILFTGVCCKCKKDE